MSIERLPITHVAIRFQGRIWSLPKPYRHHHIIRMIMFLSQNFSEYTGDEFNSVDTHGEDQGFLDSSGRYLNRKQAIVNAELNEQFRPGHPTVPHELYSEDIW